MSTRENNAPRYAIIGFGTIGQALAQAFARKDLEVAVATTRDPQRFAAEAPSTRPSSRPSRPVLSAGRWAA